MNTGTIVIFDRIIEYGIIFLSVFTPLAFGSVHVWSYTILELTVCLLVVVWALRQIIVNIKKKSDIQNLPGQVAPGGQSRLPARQYLSGGDGAGRQMGIKSSASHSISVNRFGIVKTPLNIPIILFICLAIFQLIPLPPGVLKSISPNTYQLYRSTLPGWPEKGPFSEQSPSSIDHSANNNMSLASQASIDSKSQISNRKSISIYPFATNTELLKILAYIGMFFVITNTPGLRTKRIIVVIISVGFFISLLGILQNLAGTTKIYWVRDASYASLFGPYINRNHFAGYIGMVVPLSLGYLISRIVKYSFSRGLRWRSMAAEFESHIMGNVMLVFAITIMITALLMTLSRGGILSFIVTIIVFVGLISLSRAKVVAGKGRKAMVSVLIITFGFILWLGLGPVLERLSNISSPDRYEVSRNTINMAKDFSSFGTGLGTFQYIYPKYKTLQNQLYYHHAHNDYAELLSDSGLIGFIIVSGGGVLFFWKILTRWRERRDLYVKGVTLGGICSIISMLLHSFVDFNMHIPANALFFFIILGLTYNTVNLRRRLGPK